MVFLVFLVGCFLVVIALYLAMEIHRIYERTERTRQDFSRSLASYELAMDELLEALEAKGRSILAEIERREEALRTLWESLPPEARPPGPESQLPSKAALPGHAEGDYRAQVLALASQGMNVLQIAKQLGLGQGAVQLILDLEKSKSGR